MGTGKWAQYVQQVRWAVGAGWEVGRALGGGSGRVAGEQVKGCIEGVTGGGVRWWVGSGRWVMGDGGLTTGGWEATRGWGAGGGGTPGRAGPGPGLARENQTGLFPSH